MATNNSRTFQGKWLKSTVIERFPPGGCLMVRPVLKHLKLKGITRLMVVYAKNVETTRLIEDEHQLWVKWDFADLVVSVLYCLS